MHHYLSQYALQGDARYRTPGVTFVVCKRCCNAASRFVSVIEIIIDENNPLLLVNLSACHKSQLVESARPSKSSICEGEQHETSNGIEASSEPEDSEPVPSGGHSTQNNHLNSFRNSS